MGTHIILWSSERLCSQPEVTQPANGLSSPGAKSFPLEGAISRVTAAWLCRSRDQRGTLGLMEPRIRHILLGCRRGQGYSLDKAIPSSASVPRSTQ